MDHHEEIIAHGMRVVAEALMELEAGEKVGAQVEG